MAKKKQAKKSAKRSSRPAAKKKKVTRKAAAKRKAAPKKATAKKAAPKKASKKASPKTSKKAAPRRGARPLRAPALEFTASYEPQKFETQLYRFWEESGCFTASDTNAPGQKPFCIMIPPPNVTGVLHMGHALTDTIEDILVRWRRMKGDNTLWLPGCDHAGIATQVQVEKQIAKEGKNAAGRPLTRHDLGREKFIERTWKWKEDHEGIIKSQLRRMGCSLDWSRDRFTMDSGFMRAVREVFVRLYEEGLIYRGERIINWDTVSQSALSDLEVIPTERKGYLWHIRYPVVNDDGTPVEENGQPVYLTIATTRPETLLGDTAVAVNPKDERYRKFHGKKVKLPLLGRILPIILDDYVDMEFGTGALKVTPAHDFNDYELGKKHNLPIVQVMGKDGRITAAGGPYAGMDFKTARERVVADLKEEELLVKTEEHVHKVGLAERTGIPAEPVISKQWFVKIEPLAKPALEAVESGRIEFRPVSWTKVYREWMTNIRDWCISRQLWWGHRIPAWYCQSCQEMTVARQDPESCPKCGAGADRLRQDEDVLDTWFSSALWPFVTLGWPEKTKDLKTFYPNSILETGFDIIFFWVARMIMMGIHFMGDVPFEKVYFHALVRDEKGEKMSKSKGNVIDPLELMDEHGTDSLRFTLAIMAGQGRDVKLSAERVAGYRAFCNKLWNAVKFFHYQMGMEGMERVREPSEGAEKWLLKQKVQLLPMNRWILSRLQKVVAEVERGLDQFNLDQSAQAIYDFVWGEFCDWYIELSKLPLREGGPQRKQTLITLHHCLEQILRLSHPFIPFVTEQLWQTLPWKRPANTPARDRAGLPPVETLMLQPFPKSDSRFVNAEAEKRIETLKNVIEAIRNFRGENRIPPSKEFEVTYVTGHSAADVFIKQHQAEIAAMGRLSGLKRGEARASNGNGEKGGLNAVIPISNPQVELVIDLKGLVDVAEESKRLRKEIERVNDDLQFVRRKLSNEAFVAKAPAELVNQQRGKETELVKKLQELETALGRLSG